MSISIDCLELILRHYIIFTEPSSTLSHTYTHTTFKQSIARIWSTLILEILAYRRIGEVSDFTDIHTLFSNDSITYYIIAKPALIAKRARYKIEIFLNCFYKRLQRPINIGLVIIIYFTLDYALQLY